MDNKALVKTTIYIVEDDDDIAQLERHHLEAAGYTVRVFPRASTVMPQAERDRPGLFLLDIMVPGGDGLELCQRIRHSASLRATPVIFVTARSAEADRIVGLELGADDYISKPFSPRELVARVRAILRRAQEPADVSIRRIGELEVDEARHSVTVQGTSVELTAKEFGLLCALIRANGRVLNREQLLEGVWGYADAAEIESRTVDVHIRRLREKLGAEAKRIVTVKGVGYRFDMEG